jgi:hypothetical protein
MEGMSKVTKAQTTINGVWTAVSTQNLSNTVQDFQIEREREREMKQMKIGVRKQNKLRGL